MDLSYIRNKQDNNNKLQITIEMASGDNNQNFATLSYIGNTKDDDSIEIEASGDAVEDIEQHPFNNESQNRENISSASSDDENGEWSDINRNDIQLNAHDAIEIDGSGDAKYDNLNNQLQLRKRMPKQDIYKKDRESISSSSSDDDDSMPIEMSSQFNAEWNNISQINNNNNNNDKNNDINNMEKNNLKSIDLLNDIAVNDIEANRLDTALNPDAEYIDSYNMTLNNYEMPEK